MAANDSTPPPPPPPPPGMERPQSVVPPVEAQPAVPVVTPVETNGPPVAPPPPPAPDPATGARPDPYAPPAPGYSAPGYSAPGYGYQAPANPPTSPYLQPGEPGYGAQPVAGQPVYGQPVYAQAPYGYPSVAPKTLSIVSMVLGLVGIFLGPLFSLGAVITGHIGAKREPHAKGFWLTGIISGYALLAFWVVIIVFWVLLIAVSQSS